MNNELRKEYLVEGYELDWYEAFGYAPTQRRTKQTVKVLACNPTEAGYRALKWHIENHLEGMYVIDTSNSRNDVYVVMGINDNERKQEIVPSWWFIANDDKIAEIAQKNYGIDKNEYFPW